MKTVIVNGGNIEYDFALSFFQKHAFDYVIAADHGAEFLYRAGICPDELVGDFDSWDNPETETETIVLPREKDDTDTFFGAKEGVKRGFEDFLLIGVIGGRFDHSLGNISALLYLTGLGKKALIIENGNIIDDEINKFQNR